MKHESNLTSKGQVTIPKDIRDALGLKPGSKVRFVMGANGNAEILRVDEDDQREDFLRRLAEVRESYALKADFLEMDGLEYQRLVRGDGPEV